MFDDEARSYFDELAKAGVINNANGSQIHVKKTIYGMLFFFTAPEHLRKLMGSVAVDFLYRMQYGFPLEKEAVIAAGNLDIDPDAVIKLTARLDKEMAEEWKRWTEQAMEILLTQLRETLVQTIEHHIEITMIRALLDRSGKGYYKLNVDEKEAINVLVKDHVKVFKEQLGARKRGGSSARWTSERMDELLTLYDSALEMMRGAKEIYRKHKGNKRWGQMVRAAYPELPDDLIDRFSGRGQGAEPNELAKEYAARKLGVEVNDYTEKILITARKRRADNES
jgi:hypothetical protein